MVVIGPTSSSFEHLLHRCCYHYTPHLFGEGLLVTDDKFLIVSVIPLLPETITTQTAIFSSSLQHQVLFFDDNDFLLVINYRPRLHHPVVTGDDDDLQELSRLLLLVPALDGLDTKVVQFRFLTTREYCLTVVQYRMEDMKTKCKYVR